MVDDGSNFIVIVYEFPGVTACDPAPLTIVKLSAPVILALVISRLVVPVLLTIKVAFNPSPVFHQISP